MKPNMSSDLVLSYLKTNFTVFSPKIEIKIGTISDELNALLLLKNKQDWAYITASNPYSQILSDEENNERHEQLKETVKEYIVFEGEGVGEDPKWKPEISLLILGITKEDAISIGNQFQQNAIIVGALNKKSELVLLQPIV